MHKTLSFALVSFAALILCHTIKALVTHLRHASKARALGCRPCPDVRTNDPSGLRYIFAFLDADKTQRLPSFLVESFEAASQREGRPVGTVYIKSPPFAKEMSTADPKNIQAMLALQFKDFSLGASRKMNFRPLLGHGIVRLQRNRGGVVNNDIHD
jgi:hypothetical protein